MALADCVNQALTATQRAVGNARSADPDDVPKLILKRAEERRAAAPVRPFFCLEVQMAAAMRKQLHGVDLPWERNHAPRSELFCPASKSALLLNVCGMCHHNECGWVQRVAAGGLLAYGCFHVCMSFTYSRRLDAHVHRRPHTST